MRLIASCYVTAQCLALASFFLEIRAYEHSIATCAPVQSGATVYVVESIYVSTYVQQNTTFGVNDYLTITVNDAPTTLDEVIVGTSTSIINSVANG